MDGDFEKRVLSCRGSVVPHNIYNNKLGQPYARARRHTRFFKMRDMQPFEYASVRLWSKENNGTLTGGQKN